MVILKFTARAIEGGYLARYCMFLLRRNRNGHPRIARRLIPRLVLNVSHREIPSPHKGWAGGWWEGGRMADSANLVTQYTQNRMLYWARTPRRPTFGCSPMCERPCQKGVDRHRDVLKSRPKWISPQKGDVANFITSHVARAVGWVRGRPRVGARWRR